MNRWGKALLAILLGNLVYFAAMPKLPPVARHAPFRLDLGLLLDCGICGLLLAASSLRRPSG